MVVDAGGPAAGSPAALLNISRASRAQADFLSRAHRYAADRYAAVNLWLGLPSAILAAVSGVSAFAQQTLAAGVTAFAVAALTAASTFLNPGESARLHHAFATDIDAWATRAYLFEQRVTIKGLDAEAALEQMEALVKDWEQLLRQAPRLSRWASRAAGRDGARRGGTGDSG